MTMLSVLFTKMTSSETVPPKCCSFEANIHGTVQESEILSAYIMDIVDLY